MLYLALDVKTNLMLINVNTHTNLFFFLYLESFRLSKHYSVNNPEINQPLYQNNRMYYLEQCNRTRKKVPKGP